MMVTVYRDLQILIFIGHIETLSAANLNFFFLCEVKQKCLLYRNLSALSSHQVDEYWREVIT